MYRYYGVVRNYLLVLFLPLSVPVFAHVNLWKDSTEAELRKNFERLSSNSLNRFAECKYSQYGEEGIIKEIFRRLQIEKGFFVEFGAMDGIEISNTRSLWESGWEGVMIEPSSDLYNELSLNYPRDSGVMPLKLAVTYKADDKNGLLFDEIYQRYFPEREIDFLSIDVDGADYYILKGLKCRPKVIMIEANLAWHPLIKQEVCEEIALANRQQPLEVYIEVAKRMGYEPVCLTINLFLVRKDLHEAFKETPNDAMSLWRDAFRALPFKSSLPSILQQWEEVDYSAICPIDEQF